MERPLYTAIVRINSDLPCHIYRFGKEIGRAGANDYTEIYLPKGKHRLSFVSTENANDNLDVEKEILDVDYEDIIDISLSPVRDARLEKERAEQERKLAELLTIEYSGDEVILKKCSEDAVGDIAIPDGVTRIGEYAFSNCDELTSVVIPNSVTSMGHDVFSGCSSLTSVVLNSNAIVNKSWPSDFLEPIDHYYGLQIRQLKELVIGSDVTKIGDNAFFRCGSFTSVTIPKSVTSIDDGAFRGCSFLEKAEFSSIESICKILFNSSSSNPLNCAEHLYINGQEVKEVVIPNNVTRIGNYAFYGCSNLTSVSIGNNVTSIGRSAFYGCSGLISITIPIRVKSVGDFAFGRCVNLISISVTSGNRKFDSRQNCNAIIETATNTLVTGCKNTIIPDSVTGIGKSAFSGCSGLTSIIIPKGVTSIGVRAFVGCRSLLSVTCLAKDMPIIGEDVFKNVPQGSATLYVPASAIEAYKAAEQWKEFGQILPISE